MAFVAALVNLIIVGALGNQWYVEHVADKQASNGANRILKGVPAAFRWRYSHWSGDHGLRLGEVVGSGALIVLVFLLTWMIIRAQLRPRGFFGAGFAVWGGVLLSAVVASMIGTFVSYPGLYGKAPNPLGTTRFWWSVLEGPSAQVVLFGLLAGLITGFVCAMITVTQGVDSDEDDEDDAPRPEDAFFPPRAPQLTSPAAQVAAASYGPGQSAGFDGNPDLADYGWSPEEAATRTQALPEQGFRTADRFSAPAAPGSPAAEEEGTKRHPLYAEPRPEAAPAPADERPVDPTQEIPVRDPSRSGPMPRYDSGPPAAEAPAPPAPQQMTGAGGVPPMPADPADTTAQTPAAEPVAPPQQSTEPGLSDPTPTAEQPRVQDDGPPPPS